MTTSNITNLIKRRETSSLLTRRFQRQLHVTSSFAERLGLEAELEFVPCTGDASIATAAADAKVRIHSVETVETKQVFHCHIGRVKRLAVRPNSPDLLFSASEDGTIRQFDLRQSHSCNSTSNTNCKNALINLNIHVGAMAEAKCISVNPVQPNYIAIGCNDPFVRLYDHRMLSTQMSSQERKQTTSTCSSLDEARLPQGCVTYFAPGHLPPRLSKDFPRELRPYVATYVNFSPDGNEIITNLGGEQVYLFDIRNPLNVVGYRHFNGINGTKSSSTNGVVKDVISSTTFTNHSNVTNGTSNGFTIPPINERDESSSSGSSPSSEKSATRRRRRRLSVISDQERILRGSSYDYSKRFCGHCNTTTDIKEANFFGSNGQYIVAGSDDGSFFMWNKETTNLVRVLKGDDSIVNCLQPHPSVCLLATSGIDPVIRLWSPRPIDGKGEDRQVSEVEAAARANQKRMNADPLEIMLMNMGYRTRFSTIDGSDDDDDDGDDDNPVHCRTA
ncbi:hypothetical protein QZH41_001572 [Actinostola sp. cb2023]|nr:hypothetical protein QZH41_001572 [Actinostola sp. cb2023]